MKIISSFPLASAIKPAFAIFGAVSVLFVSVTVFVNVAKLSSLNALLNSAVVPVNVPSLKSSVSVLLALSIVLFVRVSVPASVAKLPSLNAVLNSAVVPVNVPSLKSSVSVLLSLFIVLLDSVCVVLIKNVSRSVTAACTIVPLSFNTTRSAAATVVDVALVSPSMMLSSAAVAVILVPPICNVVAFTSPLEP